MFLPHQFLAILYMLAARTYKSQASSIFEDPLYKRTLITTEQRNKRHRITLWDNGCLVTSWSHKILLITIKT